MSSNAVDVQGTEYPTPSFLPPDVDFNEYPYCFLTVNDTPENPSYRFFCVKQSSDYPCLYFSVASNCIDSKLFSESHSAYGISTNYDVYVCKYDNSTGFWSYSTFSSGNIYGWVFDGYSSFDSSAGASNKYIIGSNVDIYDYSGVLLRAGDYNTLCSYFKNGLVGSSDKSQNPQPTTSGGSSGNVSIDLGDIPVTLGNIFDKLGAIADSLNAITTAISATVIADKLDEMKNLLDETKNLLSNFIKSHSVDLESAVSSLSGKLDEIKTEILNFERYFSEFSSVNGEIKNIFSALSGVNQNISNLKQSIESKFDNFTNSFNSYANDVVSDIKDNVLNIRGLNESILSKLDSLINRIPTNFTDIMNSIIDCINSVSGKISDSYSELKNISYYSNWINNNIRDYFSWIQSFLNDELLTGFCTDIYKVCNNIYELLLTYCYGIADSVTDIRNSVVSLPKDLKALLIELFIPKDKDRFSKFIDEINEHFGFVHQIIELGDVLISDDAVFFDIKPSYSIKFDSDTYGHFQSEIIDFSVVQPYIKFIKALNTGIVLYFFIRRTRKRLPEIISGTGGD